MDSLLAQVKAVPLPVAAALLLVLLAVVYFATAGGKTSGKKPRKTAAKAKPAKVAKPAPAPKPTPKTAKAAKAAADDSVRRSERCALCRPSASKLELTPTPPQRPQAVCQDPGSRACRG